MCELKFLKLKDEMFFNSVKELIENKWEFQVELWLEDNGREYVYDIIKNKEKCERLGQRDYVLFTLKFRDEGGYYRTLTIPFGVLFYTKTKGAKLFKQYILKNIYDNKLFIVKDRQDYLINKSFFQEEEENKEKKERVEKENIKKNYESTLYHAVKVAATLTSDLNDDFQIYMDTKTGEVLYNIDFKPEQEGIKLLCIVKGWSISEILKSINKSNSVSEILLKKEQEIEEEIKKSMGNYKW